MLPCAAKFHARKSFMGSRGAQKMYQMEVVEMEAEEGHRSKKRDRAPVHSSEDEEQTPPPPHPPLTFLLAVKYKS